MKYNLASKDYTEYHIWFETVYRFKYKEKYEELFQKHFNSFVNKDWNEFKKRKEAKKALIPEMIEFAQQKAIDEGIPACPLCGLRISQIYKHVLHCHKETTWKQFEADGWKFGKVFYTMNHKRTLSTNKKLFYDSERGSINKQILKERYSGDKNPAKRIEVREKISKARLGMKKTSNAKAIDSRTSVVKYMNRVDFPSYGYLFWTMIGNKEHLFKSKTEYAIYLMLKFFGITNFEFEPFSIEYFDEELNYNRHYILDLLVNDRFFEIKSNKRAYEFDSKYNYVNKKLNKLGKKLTLLTVSNFAEIFGIDFKTFSKFDIDSAIINEIRLGNCKVKLPIVNKGFKFLKQAFGENFEVFIEEGNKKYENQKSNSK